MSGDGGVRLVMDDEGGMEIEMMRDVMSDGGGGIGDGFDACGDGGDTGGGGCGAGGGGGKTERWPASVVGG
ncbi:hypothetical protein Tco_0211720 [Tanacetum coccineum]